MFSDNNAATNFSSEQRVIEKVVRNGQVLRDVDYTVFRRPHQMMVVANRPVATRRPRRSSNKKGKGFKKKTSKKRRNQRRRK